MRLQDDAYDFMDPRAPWSPLGATAELYGVSLILLAAALVMLPRLLLGGPPARVDQGAAIGVAAGVAATGVTTWLSGHSGSVVEVPGGAVAGVLMALGWPALVIGLLSRRPAQQTVHRRWRVTLGVCLVLASPVPQVLLAPAMLGYVSYDTAPWFEAVAGLFLMAAAALVIPLLPGRQEKPTQPDAVARRSLR